MTDQTTTTRRAVLAGAAALPAAALALPAAAEAEHPAVVAYRTWREADRAHRAYCDQPGGWPDGDPEERRLGEAEWDARKVPGRDGRHHAGRHRVPVAACGRHLREHRARR